VAVPKSWSNVYSAIGFFLSFLLSIRVSSSNNLNGEALILIGNIRGACRNMAKASCNYALKSNDAKTLDEVTGLRVSIRRHCDLLWAFMRQDLRESREGFHPKSDMAKVAFGPSTYMDDPALPLLIDRLTDKEMEMYATLSTSERVVTTARKLSKELHLMSQFMVCQNEYAANANSFCDGAVQKWSACRKVLDLSIPFVFKHMLYNLLFVFCLVTPFVQFQVSKPCIHL
jgi:predicted membrane chloride channel (bestrophin family)